MAGGYERSKPHDFLNKTAIPYRGEDCLFWPYSKNGNGYGRIGIKGKRRLVHRIVCEAVHGAPPTLKHEAAHSCGKGHLGCVNPNHLSWKTRAENFADKLLHGTDNRGEKNGYAKLTNTQALAIKRALSKGETPKEIAPRFNVSPGCVDNIRRGDSWFWL